MITIKERARRFGVRLKTLFNIPEYNKFSYKVNGKTKRSKLISNARIPVKIPNFWYDPFELYVLAHIQRAHFIMTCNEWAYVDGSIETLNKQPRYLSIQRQRITEYEYKTESFNTLRLKKRVDEFAEIVKKKDENTNTQTESNN
jgi:hypothetical protein